MNPEPIHMPPTEVSAGAASIGSPEKMTVNYCELSVGRSQALLDRLARVLSETELTKARRFRRSVDRDRFILGRGFVRVLAAQTAGVDPSLVAFGETTAGKPCLEGIGLEFNVSHSGDSVLVAWSFCFAVGADVEFMSPKNEPSLEAIAGISFSAQECAVLSAAAPTEKAATFYRIWVRKEAVIKAEGVGLGGPLQAFDVARLEGDRVAWPREVAYPQNGRVWSLADVEANSGHAAALAVPQGAIVQRADNVLLSAPW